MSLLSPLLSLSPLSLLSTLSFSPLLLLLSTFSLLPKQYIEKPFTNLGLVIGFLALGFCGVEDLEDARNFFGIGADHVPLRHRPHMEEFTAENRRRDMVKYGERWWW